MDRTIFLQRYWNYYSKLEQDCVSLSQYVEFRESNFNTCSNVLIGQMLNVGAEFDHFCKIVCGLDTNKRPNIADYAEYLLSKIENLNEIRVHVQGTSIELFPFKDWSKSTAGQLFWWDAYNKVKHNREEYYEQGNLENLLNALAALYFLEMYYVRDIAQKSKHPDAIDLPMSASQLFRIVGWVTRFSFIGYNTYTDYEPDFDGIF